MTRSHPPSHRQRGGAGMPQDVRGAAGWLRPLGYGLLAWALGGILILATPGGARSLAASQALLVLLAVPLAATLGKPDLRRRLGTPGTMTAHVAVAAGLTALLLLLAPPSTAGVHTARGDAIVGLAGYALVLGGTTLGWRQAEGGAWDAALRQAQDAATRARLNPHFLFNTLHALASLVRHDRDAAAEAVTVLGELLRYVLDEGAAGDVPLQREWAFVEGYIHLERLRLGDRLTVDLQMDPETLVLPFPSLCLQPLVENAIRHGIAPQASGGRVTVTVQLRDESLVIRVSDTGVGADATAVGSAPGLGIRAIRRRIEDRYHGAARLDLASSPGRGFTAELVLPVEASLSRPRQRHDRGYAHRR